VTKKKYISFYELYKSIFDTVFKKKKKRKPKPNERNRNFPSFLRKTILSLI
jgi:hypothetical protein